MGCSHTIIPASEGHLFACPGSRIGSRVRWIRAYRPQTNGKAERFIRIPQDEWLYARSYRSNADRPRELPRWLYRYHYRRPHRGINGAVLTSRL